jgi:hypothetical protein
MRSTTQRKKSEMQSDVQKMADRYEHIVYWSDEPVPRTVFSVAYTTMTLRRYLGSCGKQLRRTSFFANNRARFPSHVTPLHSEDDHTTSSFHFTLTIQR